jgi:hypothetical protein
MGKKPLVGMVGLFWAGLTLSGCMHSNSNDKATYRPTPTVPQAAWNNTPKNNSGNAVVGNNGDVGERPAGFMDRTAPTPNSGTAGLTPSPDSRRLTTDQNVAGRGLPGTTPPATVTPTPGTGMPGQGDLTGTGPTVTPNIQRVSTPSPDTPIPPPPAPAVNQTMRPSFDQNRPSPQMKIQEFPPQGETVRTPAAGEDSQRIYSAPSGATPPVPPPPPPLPGQPLPPVPAPAAPAATGATPGSGGVQTTDTVPPSPTPLPLPGTK